MWSKGWFRALMIGLGSFSVLLFAVTLIAIPILIVHLPADYFVARERHPQPSRHPVIHWTLLLLKNALGILLLVTGLVMLLTPGQGILTLLIGLTLMNFPGKYRFERWLVTRRPVHHTIDWLRARAHVAPLALPEKG